jgi:hypothetical protein
MLRSAAYTAAAFVFLLLTSSIFLHAQCGPPPHILCDQDDCRTDQILINTGYDHQANAPYPIGAQDGYWTVITDGAPTRIPVPRPADVIAPAPIWPITLPNSNWINGNGNARDGFKVKVTYQTCFCTCGPSDLNFNMDVLADLFATIYVDGVLVGATPNPGFNAPTNLNFVMTVGAGKHCIDVIVDNPDNNFSGLNIAGTVTGPNLLRRDCCGLPVIPHDRCDTNRVTYGTDDEWTLVGEPVTCGGIIPRCADFIAGPYWPAPWGSPLPGSSWIGGNTGGTSCANAPGSDIYTYRKSFCVAEPGTFVITITGMADDSGVVDLNGVTLSPAGTFFNYATPTSQTYIVSLEAGCHCLDIRVFDLGFGITGLDAVLDIQGGHLLKPECCDCDECFYSRAGRGGQNGNDGAPAGVTTPNGHDAADKPMLVSVPNPASSATMVHYVLDKEAEAHVELYNSAGQRVLVVDEGVRSKGAHAVPLATAGLAKGAYHLRLVYGTHTLTVPVTVP